MDEDQWQRLTRDLLRIGKKRGLLYGLAITFGLIGFLMIGAAWTLGRGTASRWLLDLGAGVCVAVAILLRIWAERF